MELPDGLDRLAQRQHSVATRTQLADAGVTRAEIRWRLGRRWRLLLPGVVQLEPQLPTMTQRRMAALLYAGPDSWLAGPTALALHGWPSSSSPQRIHVLVPPSHRTRDMLWVCIRRTAFTDERVIERRSLRYSCLARAVVDSAAAAADDAECRVLLIEAVQRRLVRLDDVAHWVDVRRPNGRARLHRALAEAASGAWSLPEADLARLVTRSGRLPPVWLNPELRDRDGLRLTTPDLWFDDVGVAVMVHSRRFHAGFLDWENTVDRDGDLTSNGVVVVGVTPGAIAGSPQRVLERIETVHAVALRSGHRADVVATPRIVSMSQAWGSGG